MADMIYWFGLKLKAILGSPHESVLQSKQHQHLSILSPLQKLLLAKFIRAATDFHQPL
jgi:hypothetical protein